MTTTYSAPGKRFIAEAFGKTSWISSRSAAYGKGKELPHQTPITHAVAWKNSFGAVGFNWCLSLAEAEAELAARYASDLHGRTEMHYQIVPVTSRPETADEVV